MGSHFPFILVQREREKQMDEPKDDFDDSEQEPLVLRFQCFIPENEYGIEEGYYIGNALVQLLRDNKDKPDVIQFIADMLEE